MKLAFAPHQIKQKSLHPIKDNVIVADMSFEGRQLSSGILMLSDNGKGTGIRPRWGRVYAVGPEQKDVQVGQWIMVAHGRWTRGVSIEDEEGKKTIRKVDPKDILLISDQMPEDDTISDALHFDTPNR